MLKSIFLAALLLTIATQLDQHFTDGRYTEATFAMLHAIRHGFGV